MTKSQNILSTIFSVSLLVLPLLVVQADGQQAARAEDGPIGKVSSPLSVATIIRYCNQTSRSINSAIGYSPNLTAWNWRSLASGSCRRITFDKGYKGTILFYVDASGSRPFSQQQVGGGNYCFEYAAPSNSLNFRATACPNNL